MAKILVIEDEAPIRDEVIDWLQFEGYEACGAANGRLGLEAIHRELPDLILCDIAMPEVDGHTVLIEVRSTPEFSQIPFVFLTAAADRDSMRKAMNMGADDYITKPFTHAEVLSTIQSRLERRNALLAQQQQHIDMLNASFAEEHEKRLFKSRLVAMFSHDFRNPLTTILSSSGMIRRYGERLSPEKMQRYLDNIEGSVYRLLQMLDDMLMVLEMESGRLDYLPQPTDLTALIEGMIEEFRLMDQNAHGLTFTPALPASVKIDPKLLRQVLTNLISNALKYSPSGSEIVVTAAKNDSQVVLTVQDQGIGIPLDGLAQLFEPFYRAENVKNIRGTGLGLCIVKDCVERQQGRVAVESELGKGTLFVVELPIT